MATVRLGAHFDEFVEQMVASGRYATASEVLRDGLRLLEDREESRRRRLAALEDDIRKGLESGPAEPHDMEELIAEWEASHTAQAAE